eukprot:4197443-Amphidinium_carterae.2
MPVTKGTRYSIAIYSPKRRHAHGVADGADLISFGFPVDNLRLAHQSDAHGSLNLSVHHLADHDSDAGCQPADEENTLHDNPSCVDMHEALEAPTGLWTEHCNHDLDKNVTVFAEALGYSVVLLYHSLDPTMLRLTCGWIMYDMVMYPNDLIAQFVTLRIQLCDMSRVLQNHSLEFCIVTFVDLSGPFEEAGDNGENLVMALRVLNKDRKLVLLPHCVPLGHKSAAEVTPAIVDYINRVPHLRQLRGFEGLHTRRVMTDWGSD